MFQINNGERCSEKRTLTIYQIISMQTQADGQIIREVASCMVSWSLILLTTCAWLPINCFNTLSIYCIAGAIAVIVCGLGTCLFQLQNTAQTRIDSAEIVRKKRSSFFGYNRSR